MPVSIKMTAKCDHYDCSEKLDYEVEVDVDIVDLGNEEVIRLRGLCTRSPRKVDGDREGKRVPGKS